MATSADPGAPAVREPRPVATPAWMSPRERTPSVLTESGSTIAYSFALADDSTAAVQSIRAAIPSQRLHIQRSSSQFGQIMGAPPPMPEPNWSTGIPGDDTAGGSAR